MCRPSFAIDREWFRFGRDRHDSRQFKSGIGAGIVVARDLNIDRNMQRRGKSLGSMSISSQAPADRAHSRCFPRAAKTPKQCRVARKIQCEGDRISAGLIAMTMKPTKPMGGDTDQQPAFVGSRRPHCRRASYDRFVERIEQPMNFPVQDVGVFVRVPICLAILIIEGEYGSVVRKW